MKNNLIYLITVLFLAFPGITKAQTDLSQPVPIETGIRTGVLENGLTYYIKHNEEPKERASFYIIQNVGALLEEDHQNGLAHFLEHMAFNGTENFEGKGIINTLENYGVAFGSNINAYTSFNETVYNITNVPTNPEGLEDTCLLVLHDWSNHLLLTEEEIDLERGVITEEWRTRRNSGFRLRQKWFPVVFKGSKWTNRDVIGDTTVIKYHKPETLRDFYHNWYRTDLQAIAIVGDINVDSIENRVKDMFSPIKAVKNPPERPTFKIPDHDETYFVVATDDEATHSVINIYIRHENLDGKFKNYREFRERYIEMLYNKMAGDRISELLQKGEPPFINAYSRKGGFVRGYDIYNMGAIAKDGEEAKALERILIETERIKRYGFTAEELERAKKQVLANIENTYKQRDKIANSTYCTHFARHFLTGKPINGIEDYYMFGKETMPTITLEELSARAQKWITDKNISIALTRPAWKPWKLLLTRRNSRANP
jgi:zinc protease